METLRYQPRALAETIFLSYRSFRTKYTLFVSDNGDELTEPMDPGTRLKAARARLGITTREVADLSKRIAESEQSDEFLVSGPWLTQIENERTAIPSIFKLFTLSSIYGLSFSEVVAFYGVHTEKLSKYHAELPISKTHLARYDSAEPAALLEVPVRFDAGLNLDHTNLLSRMIETWGRVPLELIQHFDLRNRLYGFIGLKDFTLYPLIRPGAFLEIDPDVKTPRHRVARSEFDRPIFFVDLRTEYACSWCDVVKDKLILVPHPLSPAKARIFVLQKEAEIIGQVTGMAMRIALSFADSFNEISKGQE